MYVRTYVCMYMLLDSNVYVDMYVRTYIRMYLCTYVRTQVHEHICKEHTYVHTYIRTYVRMLTLHITNTYIHTYVSTYVCTGMFIHKTEYAAYSSLLREENNYLPRNYGEIQHKNIRFNSLAQQDFIGCTCPLHSHSCGNSETLPSCSDNIRMYVHRPFPSTQTISKQGSLQ